MRRLLLGLPLVGLLCITTTGATAGQLSSDESTGDRTTEIPGSTFGVTLPLAWRIWSVTSERAGEVIYASDVQGRHACMFSLESDVSSAQAKAAETVDAVSRRKFEVQQTEHDVPAGTAIRVSYRLESLPDQERWVQQDYYLDAPRGVVSVHCWGDPPAADRWLSIVEAIAALPAGGVAATRFDPRVEVAEHGFAVDFPDEWHVDSASGWPGIVLGGDFVLRARTANGADCWLEDDTDVPDLVEVRSADDWRTAFTEAVESGRARGTPLSPGRHLTEATVGDAGLTDVRSVRVDWETWRDGPATAWVFLEGNRRVVLLCRSAEAPEDRWRSIAETFEFLPAEQ